VNTILADEFKAIRPDASPAASPDATVAFNCAIVVVDEMNDSAVSVSRLAVADLAAKLPAAAIVIPVTGTRVSAGKGTATIDWVDENAWPIAMVGVPETGASSTAR
jgi:hypothetical protein